MRGWVFLFITPFAMANFYDSDFYQKRNEGFYAYEKIPLETKENNTTKTKNSLPIIPDLNTLTRQELSKLLDDVKDVAIVNPSYENVHAYQRIQAFMVRKSQQFQEQYKMVALDDDTLNVAGDSPEDSFTNSSRGEILSKKNEALLRRYAPRTQIILYYTQKTNELKDKMTYPLNLLRQDYGLKYKFVDITGHKEFMTSMKMKTMPDLWMYVQDEDKIIKKRIQSGLSAHYKIINIMLLHIKNIEKQKSGVDE